MATSDDGSDESRLERLATYKLSPDDIEFQEVVVEEGEEVDTGGLSTQTVRPESLDEIRDMIGVGDEDTLPLRDAHVPSFIPTADEIGRAMESDSQSPGSADEPLRHCLDCILYRGAENATISRWATEIDELVREGMIQPELDLFPANDITIKDGGRFNVGSNTNVLFADRIEIFGAGELTYEGNLKIDCSKTVGRP